jgi:dipeptidyl aminopeptidase/acylaminoacyl peptidase
MKGRLGLAIVLLAATNTCLTAQQHFPSNEDLRQLRTISSPQLSPDLKHVVVSLQDSTADGGRSHLWLLDTNGGPYRQLTFSEGDSTGERNAEYLPDGSAILFPSRRGGKSNLYRLPLDGGEAEAVKLERAPVVGEAAAAVGVMSYSISPDGSLVAVIATDPEPASRARDNKDKKDVTWVEHNELAHRLYVLDTKTWKPREVPTLTDMDSVAWSEQSDKLVVLTHARLRDLGPSAIGWMIAAQNLSDQKKIDGLPESTHRVAFTHKGNDLVLFAKCEKDSPEGCSDIVTFNLATAKLHNLTVNLKDTTLASEQLNVADDDRSVLVSVTHGMRRTVALIDLSDGHAKLLDFGLPTVSGLREQGKSKNYVYLGSSSTSEAGVYTTASLDQAGRRLVQPETTPASWMAVPSKLVTWKRGGFTIEGLLYLPPQASSGKVPLVVNVHGGPRGQFTDTYSPLTNLLVGQGWAVLITNPRGSTGYGVEFEAANKDDMGNGDYLDIIAGVDEVIRVAPVDADKMALIGYSYGGEMAGFVEGKTNRFKAIISGAPVIDQFSEYGTESGSYGDRWYTGQPWRHFESAWRQSPLAYAEHAKTPFMLLQGQSDTTDPEGQSREMYRALRQEGVPVQLLLFPREDHGALGGNFAGRPSTEPWAGVIARDHMIKFMSDAFAGKVEPNKP